MNSTPSGVVCIRVYIRGHFATRNARDAMLSGPRRAVFFLFWAVDELHCFFNFRDRLR